MINSPVDLSVQPIEKSRLEQIATSLSNVLQKTKAKKIAKKGLVYTGLLLTFGYPAFVGAGALYYSTGEFTFSRITERQRQAKILCQNLIVPDYNTLTVITGGNKKTGDTALSCYDAFFNIIQLTNTNQLNEEMVNKIFYHEVGHSIYQRLSKENKDYIDQIYMKLAKQKKEKEIAYETLEILYHQLQGENEEKTYIIKKYTLPILTRLMGFYNEGNHFIIENKNANEFMANQVQRLWGGDNYIPIPDFSSTINDFLPLPERTEKPTIVYSTLSSFPQTYKHMFVEGIKSAF